MSDAQLLLDWKVGSRIVTCLCGLASDGIAVLRMAWTGSVFAPDAVDVFTFTSPAHELPCEHGR
jgi:hypothetical protein